MPRDMTAEESRHIHWLAHLEKYPLKVKLESNVWQKESSQVITLGVQNTNLLSFNSTVPLFGTLFFPVWTPNIAI